MWPQPAGIASGDGEPTPPPKAMEAIQQNSDDLMASCLSWGILLHTFASC